MEVLKFVESSSDFYENLLIVMTSNYDLHYDSDMVLFVLRVSEAK